MRNATSIALAIVAMFTIACAAGSTEAPSVTQVPAEARASTTPAVTLEPAALLEQLKSAAVRISYDDLFRNNEDHVGKTVWLSGQVIQVIEGNGNEYQLRVNVTKEEYYWEDTVLLGIRAPDCGAWSVGGPIPAWEESGRIAPG